jgi:hypothetical protein
MIPVVGQNVGAPAGPAGQPPVAPGPGSDAAGGAANLRAVGYQPVVSSIQQGAALQITPIVTVGGKLVVLDVHSRVLQLQAKSAGPRPAVETAPPVGSIVRDVVAALDRPVLVNHHLETTLRVPVDRRMLVGGMTFTSRPEVGEPNLYLFVKVSVQELRDDQPEGKAGAVAEPKAGRASRPKPQK